MSSRDDRTLDQKLADMAARGTTHEREIAKRKIEQRKSHPIFMKPKKKAPTADEVDTERFWESDTGDMEHDEFMTVVKRRNVVTNYDIGWDSAAGKGPFHQHPIPWKSVEDWYHNITTNGAGLPDVKLGFEDYNAKRDKYDSIQERAKVKARRSL